MAMLRNLVMAILFLVMKTECMVIETSASDDSLCDGCRADQMDVRSQYHLEQLKERIQSALGLDLSKHSEPQKMAISELPAPIRNGDLGITGEESDEILHRNVQRQIILSQQGQKRHQDKPYLKFKLSLNSLAFGKKISSADLWLSRFVLKKSYRVKMRLNHNDLTVDQQTMVIGKKEMPVSVRGNGWQSFSVKNLLEDFIHQNITNIHGNYTIVFMIKVSKTLGMADANAKESGTKDFRPFLVVETVEKTKSRRKRAVDCVAGKNHRCCRGKLRVRFADIGLGDHVIEPREFDAYQCMGTCGSFSSNVSPRVEIVKSVLSNLRMKQAKTDHIKFCCTAERSGSQKLIYYNNDKTQILAKNVKGLIVESCDCL